MQEGCLEGEETITVEEQECVSEPNSSPAIDSYEQSQ